MKSINPNFSRFIIIGTACAAAIILLILFAYLLFWGSIIGAILYAGYWIKQRFFAPKPAQKIHPNQSSGRIIEHE